MLAEKNTGKVLNLLLRNILMVNTITSLAKEIKFTRVGIWKLIKRMEAEKLVVLSPVGKGKTSIYSIKLNWENPLVEKNLSMILAEQASENKRWISNFLGLQLKAKFIILYGSILENAKEAGDIDLIIVAKNKDFADIDKSIIEMQKTQVKKIHALSFTESELKDELLKQNKAFLNAVKKGLVLFGHEEFIKFIRAIK